MEIHSDFREWLALLDEHDVDYVVVGAFALAHYGCPRYTGDLDVLVRPETGNARRLLGALERFGFGALNLSTDDFLSPDTVVQLGYPPVRIDLLTGLTGVETENVFAEKKLGSFAGTPCQYISKAHYIQNKQSLGRPQDLADIAALNAEAPE